MAVTSEAFRQALGHFASGVTVVTTRNASGQPCGLTASAFTSVSLDPPLILVCIDHQATSASGKISVTEAGVVAQK